MRACPSLNDLRPLEPLQRYEHEAPGGLLHIDTKRLGRIVRPSHRVTGNRRDGVDGAGWETLFVAIDDHARIAFMAMHPDEKTPQAVQFLKDAVAYCARLGVSIKRPLTETVRCSARTTSREPARGPGHQAPFHACLPAADQRQGRALHPVGPARVGLRLGIPELDAQNSGPGQLAASLQLAPPSQWHGWCRTHVQTHLVKKQRLDASQPAAAATAAVRPDLRLTSARP